MSANPWDKFFWNDYENDPALKLCTLGAQGLWMRALCICAKADPKGYLVVAGRPLNSTDLASLVGKSEQEVETLLRELASYGVYSTDRNGRIYSRRMVRDVKKFRTAVENGKNGGNPSLSKDKGNSASDKGSDKSQDKPQSPEANSHEPKKKDNALARFDEFWNSAPKKTGQGGAERAWVKARKIADADTLIAAIRRYAETQRGVESAYIKTPGPWLNEKRWLDADLAPKAEPDITKLRESRATADRLGLPTDRIDRAIEEAEARAA